MADSCKVMKKIKLASYNKRIFIVCKMQTIASPLWLNYEELRDKSEESTRSQL